MHILKNLFLTLFLINTSITHAGEIMREADCGKDKICIEEFQKQKNLWLQCLRAEGISEKKRKKLSVKVEMFGIRNLKKQEVLIFNSGRKTCHKEFYKTLSELPYHKEKMHQLEIQNPFTDFK